MASEQNVVIKNNVPVHLKGIPAVDKTLKYKLHWKLIITYTLVHAFAIYGVFNRNTMLRTYLFNFIYHTIALLGITAGVHRLWSHRSYKATLPVQIFLMLCQTACLQGPIFVWARDHRLHHKYTDTEADPYNPMRGLFYSHIGWVLSKKNKYVRSKLFDVDMSDLLNNKVVDFQNRYYLRMAVFLTFIIPTIIPVFYWNESTLLSFCICCLRHAWTSHDTFLINSVAHAYGPKPYDSTISPGELKILAFIGNGEGFHNFHHAFPSDYKTSEYSFYPWSLTTGLLDLLSLTGLVYDMKTTPRSIIEKRCKRTGDGSWPVYEHSLTY